MYLDEAERPVYEPYREAWTVWASLTSVLLALAAALVAFAAASWWVQAHVSTQQQQRHWVEYQGLASKTEALHFSKNFFTLHQLQEPKTPNLKKFVEENLKDSEKELAKLEQEWEQLKEAVTKLEGQGERAARRAAGAVRTAFLLLLATVLAAAGSVGKKKLLWLMSLILGGAGGISLLGAILLWF